MSARDEALQRGLNEAAAETAAWEASNLAEGGACDFCGTLVGSAPTVTYRTGGVIDGALSVIGDDLAAGTIRFGYDPYWLACSGCEPAVDRGDAAGLAEHVLNNRDPERTPTVSAEARPSVLAELTELYEGFFSLKPAKLVRPT